MRAVRQIALAKAPVGRTIHAVLKTLLELMSHQQQVLEQPRLVQLQSQVPSSLALEEMQQQQQQQQQVVATTVILRWTLVVPMVSQLY
jgi:hypothetical protein